MIGKGHDKVILEVQNTPSKDNLKLGYKIVLVWKGNVSPTPVASAELVRQEMPLSDV